MRWLDEIFVGNLKRQATTAAVTKIIIIIIDVMRRMRTVFDIDYLFLSTYKYRINLCLIG